MRFIDKLRQAWTTQDSLVCVGLDPDLSRIPPHLADGPQPIFAFCSAIADATADLVCAFKPQIAYFAAVGAESQLEALMHHLRQFHPQVPVILDAKRGDIGSTAQMYAAEAFERYGADAVTVNPYMGSDTLEPYLARPDKGTVVLCRTSNPGSGDFQSLDVGGELLYERVARTAREKWNAHENVALVVGATWPEELARVRALAGDLPLLVPGVGAQGGDVEAVVRNGLDRRGQGLIINSSRAILYASKGLDFAAAARAATDDLRLQINRVRASLRG